MNFYSSVYYFLKTDKRIQLSLICFNELSEAEMVVK